MTKYAPVFLVRDYLRDLPGARVVRGAEGPLNKVLFSVFGSATAFGHAREIEASRLIHAHFGQDGG